MDVSENSGTPKASISIVFSIKPSILVHHYFFWLEIGFKNPAWATCIAL